MCFCVLWKEKKIVKRPECNIGIRGGNGITMAQGATSTIQKLPPRTSSSLLANGHTNPLTLPIILNQRVVVVVREKANPSNISNSSSIFAAWKHLSPLWKQHWRKVGRIHWCCVIITSNRTKEMKNGCREKNCIKRASHTQQHNIRLVLCNVVGRRRRRTLTTQRKCVRFLPPRSRKWGYTVWCYENMVSFHLHTNYFILYM